jgi:hypothetical protein
MSVRFTKPQYVPYLLGGLALLVFLFGIAALVMQADRRDKERLRIIATTPAYTADAIVEYKEYHNPYGKRRPWGKYKYELRFKVLGQIPRLYSTNGARWYETDIGAPVIVTYHKSPTGEIFVVDWQLKRNPQQPK